MNEERMGVCLMYICMCGEAKEGNKGNKDESLYNGGEHIYGNASFINLNLSL